MLCHGPINPIPKPSRRSCPLSLNACHWAWVSSAGLPLCISNQYTAPAETAFRMAFGACCCKSQPETGSQRSMAVARSLTLRLVCGSVPVKVWLSNQPGCQPFSNKAGVSKVSVNPFVYAYSGCLNTSSEILFSRDSLPSPPKRTTLLSCKSAAVRMTKQ